MFSWFRRKEKPSLTAGHELPDSAKTKPDEDTQLTRRGENSVNPGTVVRGRAEFSNGQRTWEEEFDCVQLLVDVLREQGYRPVAQGDVIREETTGVLLRPLFVSYHTMNDGGVQTATTIEVKHPIVIPAAIFEFQHSTGATMEASLRAGFSQWGSTDLVALVDATRAEPSQCMLLTMELAGKDNQPAKRRRILLGPVLHMQENVPDISAGTEEHPFCPCCLLTKSLQAFMPLIESPGVFGVRLFAARNKDSSAEADCRVNGEDFDAGKMGLLQYVPTWPGNGIEFRKQYVFIQDAP